MPNPAKSTACLDQFDVEAFLSQAMQQVYTGETTADDRCVNLQVQGLAIGMRIAVDVPVRSFVAFLPQGSDVSLQRADHCDERI